VAHAVARGARFLGNEGVYHDATQGSTETGSYILLINSKALQTEERWQESVALLDMFLNQTESGFRPTVCIADCDALAIPLQSDHARMAYYQNGQEAIFDCREREKFMSATCFTDFPTKALRTDVTEKPVKRRFVKIACPGPRCDPTKICEWICSRCVAPIESGFSDD
jgi:hypothetical protein